MSRRRKESFPRTEPDEGKHPFRIPSSLHPCRLAHTTPYTHSPSISPPYFEREREAEKKPEHAVLLPVVHGLCPPKETPGEWSVGQNAKPLSFSPQQAVFRSSKKPAPAAADEPKAREQQHHKGRRKRRRPQDHQTDYVSEVGPGGIEMVRRRTSEDDAIWS